MTTAGFNELVINVMFIQGLMEKFRARVSEIICANHDGKIRHVVINPVCLVKEVCILCFIFLGCAAEQPRTSDTDVIKLFWIEAKDLGGMSTPPWISRRWRGVQEQLLRGSASLLRG